MMFRCCLLLESLPAKSANRCSARGAATRSSRIHLSCSASHKRAPLIPATFSLALLVLALIGIGCAAPRPIPSTGAPRTFDFSQDTFAFSNELLWSYEPDPATGKMVTMKREPEPDFALRCFAVARSARQFYDFVRFDPSAPKLQPDAYRNLVERVVKSDPRAPPDRKSIVTIPGYENLREFSTENEALIKAQVGGIWHSYFQRGNWRMVFPFTRRHQQRTAEQLLAALDSGRPPVVHLVTFPALTMNHAVVVFDATANDDEIQFLVYDPNNCDSPESLVFDRSARSFHFPANDYFAGGSVNVYEVYRGICY